MKAAYERGTGAGDGTGWDALLRPSSLSELRRKSPSAFPRGPPRSQPGPRSAELRARGSRAAPPRAGVTYLLQLGGAYVGVQHHQQRHVGGAAAEERGGCAGRGDALQPRPGWGGQGTGGEGGGAVSPSGSAASASRSRSVCTSVSRRCPSRTCRSLTSSLARAASSRGSAMAPRRPASVPPGRGRRCPRTPVGGAAAAPPPEAVPLTAVLSNRVAALVLRAHPRPYKGGRRGERLLL